MNNYETVSLEEMLLFRENKYLLQGLFCNIYPDCIIISLSLNIPGPQKINEKYKIIFERGTKKIEESLIKNGNRLIEIAKIENKCGNIAFFIVKGSAVRVIKKYMIDIEEKDEFGRLLDIDVYYDNCRQISRKDMMISERKCLICENNAKACARNQTHSLIELQQKIEEMLGDFNV